MFSFKEMIRACMSANTPGLTCATELFALILRAKRNGYVYDLVGRNMKSVKLLSAGEESLPFAKELTFYFSAKEFAGGQLMLRSDDGFTADGKTITFCDDFMTLLPPDAKELYCAFVAQ